MPVFYIIFIAVIVFALYLIFHDNREGEGSQRKTPSRTTYRPEQHGSVPLTPVSPTPKPLEPAPVVKPVAARPAAPTAPSRFVSERPLSWTYLYSLQYDESLPSRTMRTEIAGMRYYCAFADIGLVNGIVRPEPGNPHDPRAQLVVRADGKKLGYKIYNNIIYYIILYNFNIPLPLFSAQPHHVWLTLNGTMGRWDDGTL